VTGHGDGWCHRPDVGMTHYVNERLDPAHRRGDVRIGEEQDAPRAGARTDIAGDGRAHANRGLQHAHGRIGVTQALRGSVGGVVVDDHDLRIFRERGEQRVHGRTQLLALVMGDHDGADATG